MIVKNEEENPETDSDSVSEINEDNILIDMYKALNNSVLPALFVLIISIVITYLMKICPYTGYDSSTITTAPDIPTRFIHPIETQESHKQNLKVSKSMFKLNNDITTLQHHNHHMMPSSSSSLSSSTISHTHPPILLFTGITISIVINVHSESNDDELTIESQFRLSQLYMDILHMSHPPDCIFDYQLISEGQNNKEVSNKVHEDKDQSSMTVTTTSSSSSHSSSRSDTHKHTTASSPRSTHQYGYAAHFSYGDSYLNNNPLSSSSSSPFSSVTFHQEKEWLHTQVIQEMKRIAREYQVLYITIYSPHIYSDLAIIKKENKESIHNNIQNDSTDNRIQVPPTIVNDIIKDKAEEEGKIEIDIDDDYTYITPQSSTTSTTTNPTAASTTTSTTTTTTNNNMDNIHVDILNKLDFNYMMLIQQIEPTRSGYQSLRTTTPVRRVLSSEQRQKQDNQNSEDLALSSMHIYMNQCYNQPATQRRRQLYSQQQQ